MLPLPAAHKGIHPLCRWYGAYRPLTYNLGMDIPPSIINTFPVA